jgi:hypothetical protein
MGMIPTTIIYYIGFSWLVEKKAQMIERSGQSFLRINEDSTDRLASTSVQQPDTNDAQEASINQTLSWENFKRVFPTVAYYAINLGSVLIRWEHLIL